MENEEVTRDQNWQNYATNTIRGGAVLKTKKHGRWGSLHLYALWAFGGRQIYGKTTIVFHFL